MKMCHISKWCLVAALAAVGANLGLDQAAAAPQEPAAVEEEVQVLTRGPVHEAFAETITFNPEPGIVVTKAPPTAIEELPPDQRPEGDNVAWIPGYWAWDDERTDFLWASGIWRVLPPGRQWVSGYWGKSGKGFQWTSGYWADAKASEVAYLSEPPESLEVGPNTEATSPDYSWAPGSWVWQKNRYAWRPGYWAEAQPDRVWVPAHYVSTPRGYVFVDGYHDHSVGRRGVLFAPVYFDSAVSSRRGFSYSPSTVIDQSVFSNHLFLRPSYGHYYFGDYYASSYSAAGFFPWFSIHKHRGYDPFYTHQRWEHRQDRGWDRRLEASFRNRRDHEEARPPRTWAAQRERGANVVESTDKSFVVARSFDQMAKSKSPLRFQAVNQQERRTLVERGHEIRKSSAERQRLETKLANASAEKPSKNSGPAKLRPPKSPIAAKPTAERDKVQARPKTHETLKPDPNVEPKPGKRGGGLDSPKVPPKSERPQIQKKPERPQPQPERPQVQPKPERPRPQPERPRPRPQPASKDPPRGESKGNSTK